MASVHGFQSEFQFLTFRIRQFMLNRYCQGYKVNQAIPLQIPEAEDKGNTFPADCMVSIAINADFLFGLRATIDEFTLSRLNKYSSVCNQIKSIATFPTTWVSLYMMILDSITDSKKDTFVATSTTYARHQFLVNAYLTNIDRPPADRRTTDNDLNHLIYSWHEKLLPIYLLSDLISPKLQAAVKESGMDKLVVDELGSLRASNRGLSIESKVWHQAVSSVVRWNDLFHVF